jgi:hypothetical protein
MEAMKKEITRINALLSEKCMDDKKYVFKENQQKKTQYKNGIHPFVKDGLGHIKGGKINGRKIEKGYECVQFMSKGQIGTERPAQMAAQKQPRAALPPTDGSAAVKGGSAAPRRKGKATYSSSAHDKASGKVYIVKNEVQKPKGSIWATPNRYSYQSKAYAP